MNTDLTTVKDHPANILSALADTLIEGGWVRATVADSASVLREYEQEHSVTFAALDNEALEAVRTEYAKDPEDSAYTLRDAVSGLLGLDSDAPAAPWEEREALDVEAAATAAVLDKLVRYCTLHKTALGVEQLRRLASDLRRDPVGALDDLDIDLDDLED